MPHYRVYLNGVNFWLQVDGKRQRMGFYTTRFVEAANLDDAELAAVDELRAEGKLKPLNDRGDPARVLVDRIDEVSIADVPAVRPGLAFFPDDSETDV